MIVKNLAGLSQSVLERIGHQKARGKHGFGCEPHRKAESRPLVLEVVFPHRRKNIDGANGFLACLAGVGDPSGNTPTVPCLKC